MPTRIVLAVLAAGWLAAPAAAQTCAPFTDVAASDPFCTNIQWMYNRGVTLGCTANQYCPAQPVRRDQMAAFMNRLADKVVYQQGGNAFGADGVLGTTDAARALNVIVAGSRAMRYEPNAISPNVIGGSPANFARANVRGATIGGGGVVAGDTDPDFAAEAPNRVLDAYGTVGGGYGNTVGGGAESITDAAFAAVGGGALNTASGIYSTVAGGQVNAARGNASSVAGGQGNTVTAPALYGTVAGGLNNTASAPLSTVPGGRDNHASGESSFAAGRSALADQTGCFVFANWSTSGSGSCLGSTNIARFLLDHGVSVDYFSRRPDGGGTRWVYFGDTFAGQTITSWNGAHLTDTGVWTNASDRALKDGFAAIDAQAVLDGVVNLPITRWHYRHDGPAVTHIGPTAQDFKLAFGLGQSDTGIGTVDADGVALVAIQSLNAKLVAQARELASQREELADLKRAVRELLTATR